MREDIYTIIINLKRLNDTLEEMVRIHKENREIAKETREIILNKISDEDYLTEMAKGEEMLVKATEAIIKTDDMYKKVADMITKLKIAELLKEVSLSAEIKKELEYKDDSGRELPVRPGATRAELLSKLNKDDEV